MLVDDRRAREVAWVPFTVAGGRGAVAAGAVARPGRASLGRDLLVLAAADAATDLVALRWAPADLWPRFAGLTGLAALLAAALLTLGGLYAAERPRLPRLLYAWLTTISTALAALYVGGALAALPEDARLAALAGAAAGMGALALVHALDQVVDARAAAGAQQRLIVVGSVAGARRIEQRLRLAGPDRRVIATVTPAEGDAVDMLPRALAGLVETEAPSAVVLALPAGQEHRLADAAGICAAYGLRCLLAPEAPDLPAVPVTLERAGDLPLLAVQECRAGDWYAVLKRAFDLAAAGLLLLGLLPLFAVVALLVKLDSPGPVFYRQRRVGRGCRPFLMYKFRSMRQDADRELARLRLLNETDGLLFKMKRDPRVTRSGRVLRRLSIDELPQLLNVLLGHMSLVGPRPPLPGEVERYAARQYGRMAVTPGLTGLWQVSGRSDLPFEQGVALDLHYVAHRSLLLDLIILLRTIPAVLQSRGAY